MNDGLCILLCKSGFAYHKPIASYIIILYMKDLITRIDIKTHNVFN